MKHILIITIAAVVLVGCGNKNYIHDKIVNGQYGLILKYLREGGDINQKCDRAAKATPLHYSLMFGHHKISKLLIEKGADVHAVDILKNTPLHSAAVPLHSAGDPDPNVGLIELLIKKGADINARNKGGITPLSSACTAGHLDAVKKIINKGADISIRDFEGGNCLSAAAHNGHLDIVQILIIKHGFTPNIIDKTGRTALDYAEGPADTNENIQWAINSKAERKATAAFLRKHGAKTAEELEAEGK